MTLHEGQPGQQGDFGILGAGALGFAFTRGDPFTFAGTEFTSGALVNGDTIASVRLASLGVAAGVDAGSYDITASDAMFGSGSAGNYAISYELLAGGLTVTPRALTVTPLAQSKTYGAAFTFALGVASVLGAFTFSLPPPHPTPSTRASKTA